jgi:hypothetical protein
MPSAPAKTAASARCLRRADDGQRRASRLPDYLEIDLNHKHADQLAEEISRPRRAQSTSPRRGRHDQSEVRAWAREQELKVAERGRIPLMC